MTAPERFADSQIPLASRAPSIHDPCMDPPCVARENREAGVFGLAPMYQASCWSMCSGPLWKSARVRLISGHASAKGNLGHQFSDALGRPFLHLVFFSRRPRWVMGVGVRSSIAPHLGQFLCSCLLAVPSSRPARVLGRRAQGAVKAGRRACLSACPGISRPRLDGPEHGAKLTRFGTLVSLV